METNDQRETYCDCAGVTKISSVEYSMDKVLRFSATSALATAANRDVQGLSKRMRHWTEVDCPNALDCFGGGRWGKGAYDHAESSEAGGKPHSRCFCMTEQEHAEAQEELDREVIVRDNSAANIS